MFAKACGKAYKFTRPLIISTRTIDGNVSATCGTFFVVNDEGCLPKIGRASCRERV